MLDASLPAFRTHHPCQGTYGSLIDIRHFECGGIQFVAGTHGTDNRCACRICLFHQRQLALHCINGIHYIVILGEIKLVLRLRQVEGFVCCNLAVRVNIFNPFLRHVHFILPHCAAGGINLAVQVSQANFVIINQIQGADTGTGQRLHRIAADAADAKHRHAALREVLHGLRSKQQLCPGKLIQHKGTPFCLKNRLIISCLPFIFN